MKCLFTKVKHFGRFAASIFLVGSAISVKATAQCYPLPIAPGLTINCGQTAGLYAIGDGSNFLWYDQPSGGVPLDTGAMFVTPVLTQNKRYYVETNNLYIQRDTFLFSGTQDTYTVPSGVHNIDVDMYGAQGASGNIAPFTDGGLGGRLRFTMAVTPGQTLILNVGGQGQGNLGGFNGGGGCGSTCLSNNAHGGGGASDIRLTVNQDSRIAVAGGGGGAGFFGSGIAAQGGAGGGLVGGTATGATSTLLGVGGNQTTGGAAGSGNTAGLGTSFQGGMFPTTSITANYGGGGGGWFGGGAGYFSGTNGGGGGGGSSYTAPSLTNVIHNAGVRVGNGMIVISHAVNTCSSDRLPVDVTVLQNIVTPIVSGATVMCGDTATLRALGSAGLFEWYDSYTATTPIATGSSFQYGPVMGPMTFYVRSVDNYINPVCVSNKVAVLVETYPISKPVATAIINTQCGSSATLTASGSTGNYWWYDAATGGSYLGKGSYTTENLFSDTTYYYVEGISSSYPYVLDSVVFTNTASLNSWTVPFGVDSIDVDVYGAQGGSYLTAQGGLGGRVKARIPVTTGQTLYIGVGEMPVAASGAGGQTAGVANGGNGVSNTTYRRGGGGASDIRLTNTTPTLASQLLVVAGAGGGAGYYTASVLANGGAGGDSIGERGYTTSATITYGGAGGSQITGGSAYSGTTYNGSFFKGGNAYSASSSYSGGGGGGGFYGGAGGYSSSTSIISGGGGGSSFTTPEASNVQHYQGVNTGNGKVVIYYPRLVTYCSSERTKVAVVTSQLPTPTGVNDTVVCADSAAVRVLGSTGNYRWFTSATSRTPISTDSIIRLYNLKNDTTFYVEAATASNQTLVQPDTFTFTGNIQEWTVPNGVYEIEVELLGAQGGSYNTANNRGGYGAKVTGKINVTPGQKLYINVGEKPNSATGGYNGGGQGYGNYGRGGGGASDVRINGTSIFDRFIVAGGGGGNGYYSSSNSRGGYGGQTNNLENGTAENGYENGSSTNLTYVGKGATENAGGGPNTGGSTGLAGQLGLGGDAGANSTGGGGGGGWYGGGGGGNTTSDAGGGGGGSSYADPTIVSDIVYTNGGATLHADHGRVIIKYNEQFCTSNRIPVNVIVKNISDPVVQPVVLNCGDSAVLNVTSNYPVKWFKNANDVTPFAEGPSVVTSKKYANDTVYVQTYREYYTEGDGSVMVSKQFDYSGAMETFIVPDGVYEIEMELDGAQGGSYNASNQRGGYGAKVTGKMNVTPGQTLYISVGGQPVGQLGGFNGGGNGGTSHANARGGGGATDIRISGTSLSDRFIVAAGGGGNGYYSSNSYYTRGGYGGQTGDHNTTAAENGYGSASTSSSSSTGAYGGYGGTITMPGQGNTTGTAGASGQIGLGGNGATGGGGGGGGYFGGGGGGGTYNGGGGGGSSYADPNFVSNIVYTNGGTTAHADHGRVIIRYAEPKLNICESNKVAYIITVDSLAAPVVSGSTTICNQGATTFTATGGTGTYKWYENNQLVASTPSYNTGNRTTSTSVKVNYVNAQGCVSAFANGQLDIINLPSAAITSAPNAICLSTDSVQLTVANAGGSWIGAGINNAGVFKPANANIGANQIIYSIFDGASGCFNNDTVSINVDNAIAATITSNAQAVCQSLPSFNLTSVNAGGTWSGAGVVNASTGEFSPSSAGIGTHKVYYAVTNGLCTTKDSVSFLVTATPVAQIINAPSQLCLSSSPVQLSANTTGGTWSGGTIAANGQFDPLVANVGTHRVYYSLNSNGCAAIDSVDITVINAPIAQITTPNQSICITASPIALQASPAGGNWTGNGVMANTFDPRQLNAGTYKAYYQISSGGCVSTDTVAFDVVAMPNAHIVAPTNAICASDANVNLQTVTAGGTWSGSFISNNGQFDVTNAGVGTHRVYYNIANIACTAIDSVDLVVNALPVVSILYPIQQICANSPSTQYFATPAGGIWSGAGIVNATNGTFSPAVATVGNHEVYYTFTSSLGCKAIDTMYVEVSSNPVANFVVDNGCVNTDVNFTDISTNSVGVVSNWNWNFGNGTTSSLQHPSNAYTQTGTYIVTLNVATAAGCSGTITKTVQIGNAPDAAFNSVVLNDFTTVNFYPVNPEIGAAYLWTFGDGYSSTSINASHTFELAGTYTTCLTVEKNGCSQKVCNDITTTRNVSIDEKEEISFNVYPNPFVDQVNIQIKQNSAEKISASLYDITGRMIIAPRLLSTGVGEQMFTISLDQYNLSTGMYNLVLHIDGVAYTTLLIKK